jgi:hypothetical protein
MATNIGGGTESIAATGCSSKTGDQTVATTGTVIVGRKNGLQSRDVFLRPKTTERSYFFAKVV